MQKSVNGVGWLFLITLAVHVVLSFLLSIIEGMGIVMPIELQLILSEVTILLPGLIYILIKKLSFRGNLGFCKIKTGTIFMAILLSVLITPTATLVNLVTQLFVPNTLAQASNELLSGSGFVVWFLASVYGPFCEELCFRSIIHNGYEKYAGFIKALFVSALFFGLTHLNVNQACYAFVLGIMFSIINKASGSVYTSMIIHTCINGANMLLVIETNALYESLGMDMDIAQSAEMARGMDAFLYIYIAVFLVLAIGGLAIATPCVIWMAKHEGRLEEFKKAFLKKNKDESAKVRCFVNVPAIAATVFALFLMFGLDPLMQAIGLY